MCFSPFMCDWHESASPCWAPLGCWPDYGSDPGLWSIHSGKPLKELSFPLQKISMLFSLTFHFICVVSSPYFSLRIPFSQPCYQSTYTGKFISVSNSRCNQYSCLPICLHYQNSFKTQMCIYMFILIVWHYVASWSLVIVNWPNEIKSSKEKRNQTGKLRLNSW